MYVASSIMYIVSRPNLTCERSLIASVNSRKKYGEQRAHFTFFLPCCWQRPSFWKHLCVLANFSIYANNTNLACQFASSYLLPNVLQQWQCNYTGSNFFRQSVYLLVFNPPNWDVCISKCHYSREWLCFILLIIAYFAHTWHLETAWG